MSREQMWVVFLALACLFGGSGCASWFLNGAKMHEGGPPANATARFQVNECRMIGDGSPIPPPQGQSYFLAQNPQGPVLYEIDQRGEGAAIYNYWQDERGVHFFVWVGNSHGWVYTFPHTRQETPTRWVFPAGTYTVTTAPNGAKMLEGQPQAACRMVPS